MNKDVLTITQKLEESGLDYKVIKSKEILIPSIDLVVDPVRHGFIASSVPYINYLRLYGNVRFIRKGNSIHVLLGDFVFRLLSREELVFLGEIFVDGVYNIIPKGKTIAIDVGMNVGFASIFFAGIKDVQRVYAFEPFSETYKFALGNFRLNNSASRKIRPYNFGLGSTDENRRVDYIPELKGAMSSKGLHPSFPDLPSKVRTKIAVKDVVGVFGPILSASRDRYKMAKIDCEGSEYDIIARLEECGLLRQLDCLVIEWHYLGPDILISQLKGAGFSVLSRPTIKHEGLLYAFR